MSNLSLLGVGGPVTTGYTQNLIDTNSASGVDGADIALDSTFANSAALTFSIWFDLTTDTINGARFLDCDSSGGCLVFSNGGGKLDVQIKDSASATVYSSQSTNVEFSTGTQYHLFIQVDLGVPSLEIKIDGVNVTMNANVSTITAGTGTLRSASPMLFNRSANGRQIDGEVADVILDRAATFSAATLYNSGTPPDLDTVGSATVKLGGLMTADERDGNTSEGWNDAHSEGTILDSAITVTGTFLDA